MVKAEKCEVQDTEKRKGKELRMCAEKEVPPMRIELISLL
jgi:hypothetical protein